MSPPVFCVLLFAPRVLPDSSVSHSSLLHGGSERNTITFLYTVYTWMTKTLVLSKLFNLVLKVLKSSSTTV